MTLDDLLAAAVYLLAVKDEGPRCEMAGAWDRLKAAVQNETEGSAQND